jgi:protein ImuA
MFSVCSINGAEGPPVLGKTETLQALKQQVAALETRPVLAHRDSAVHSGLLAAPRGNVHEVFADTLANTGAALGFALGQARGLLAPSRPGLLILELKSDTQEIGLPYGLGLRSFGLEAEAIVLIRTDTITELLWAMEEAIACRAVAVVVADIAYAHKALDFTASRRLVLRAAESGASVFFVRYAREREASAAKFRWKVEPSLSRPPPFDNRAPGPPRWRVTLEKGSLGKRRTAPDGDVFLVDWSENGFVLADDNSRDLASASRVAALSHAAPAALGHRLSQAG